MTMRAVRAELHKRIYSSSEVSAAMLATVTNTGPVALPITSIKLTGTGT
jgi:hypothetical protein